MSEIENFEAVVAESEQALALSKQERLLRILPIRIVRKMWNNAHIWRALTLIAIILVGYLGFATRGPIWFFASSDPTENYYVEPRNFEEILHKLDRSVVKVHCDLNAKKGWFGSGWSFQYEDITNAGKSALMTNYHVIEDCINQGTITLENLRGKKFEARIEVLDEYNDLAILSSSHIFPMLTLASYPPARGSWVMAYGSADGYMGSVAIGNLINFDEYGDLMMTANISGGNSGGPLVDNEGNVFGVNTWTYNNEKANTQYNVAVSLDSFCYALIECDGDTYWDWD
jgi:S1-C subfamily serine protease